MKILNIMLGTKKGGLEQVLVDYVNAQLLSGNSVYAVCLQKCPYINDIEKTKAVLYKVKSRKIFNPFAVFKIRKIITNIKPDIIVLHGNRAVAMTVSHIINKIFKISIPVLSVINNNSAYVKDIKYAAAVSTDIQNKALTRGVENAYYVPNTTTIIAKKDYEMKKTPVIGVIGRLHINKGFDIFLDAVKELYNQGLDFKVVIAGCGPEKDNLRAKAKSLKLIDKIEFMGWLDDKSKFYDKIDVFCLSSRVEPFGIVLLEAMTRTVPVVATDCQGPLDIFENGVDGIIVKKNNVEELANGLKTLIENKELAKNIADNAYNKVTTTYSPEKLATRLENIFKQMKELS